MLLFPGKAETAGGAGKSQERDGGGEAETTATQGLAQIAEGSYSLDHLHLPKAALMTLKARVLCNTLMSLFRLSFGHKHLNWLTFHISWLCCSPTG